MRASSLLAFRCYFELPSINNDFTSLHVDLFRFSYNGSDDTGIVRAGATCRDWGRLETIMIKQGIPDSFPRCIYPGFVRRKDGRPGNEQMDQ